MTSQARANALNVKMQEKASEILDDLERNHLRNMARQSFACAVQCYDKAGKSGPAEAVENCARNCQTPYQNGSALVQNEVAQFQNRLNRNMQECQEKARDLITPSSDNQRMVARAEDALISCMSQQVDEHIKLLPPMKDRITAAFKNIK